MATQQENWETVKALFDAALEEEPASRSTFLRLHCSDERLRSEVERLLCEQKPRMRNLPARTWPSTRARAGIGGVRLGNTGCERKVPAS
jgi:hypothetical protein